MRTIKSQGGKMIVNAEKLLCIIKNKVNTHKGYSAYCISCSWWRSDFIEIAEYSTEKRALRVLDMLNGWLNIMQPEIDSVAKNITDILTEIQANMDIDDVLKMLKHGDISRFGELVNNLMTSLKAMLCFQMPMDSEELDA